MFGPEFTCHMIIRTRLYGKKQSCNPVFICSMACCLHRPSMVMWTPYCKHITAIVRVSFIASKATLATNIAYWTLW